jgi:crotonobetainyl-CoA:carnitine CoA-transferase CaiB-like acyl-CoA transferase
VDSCAALAGLRVVDFSNVRSGAQASQTLADFGAEVVHIETPGGSALRGSPAWPFWARGKKSLPLDLKDPDDLAAARRLASRADVVIETFRPGVADRLGIGYAALSAENPRLVYASVTGFGRQGPLADLQGYEGVVFAKFGVFGAVNDLGRREGPAFCSAAYASYPASQLTIQAILAALYERETSGVGQHVGTSLAQALTVSDTYNWFARVLALKYPDAYKTTARFVDGAPAGGNSFRLLIAMTKDGEWLQFSQTAPRLFRAMMKMFGLEWMFEDPEWESLPDFEDVGKRIAFWERLLTIVRGKTAAEWRAEFDRDTNVWGERFSRGSEVLDHPQMRWNQMVLERADPDFGRLRSPAAVARASGTPPIIHRPPPKLGEHVALKAGWPEAAASDPPATAAAAGGLPLAGVTVVELGTYYAGPYGTTLLSELGARVIKLEELEGDPQRNMLAFPEIAGLKALQGKESLAVDLRSEKGRAIGYRIIDQADIVLQSFRAGVAERLGLDAETLLARNPDLVYVAAPGYGEGGPCGHRPAFAPTIGAGAGLASRNAGAALPESAELSLDAVKAAIPQILAAVQGVGNSDGLSSVTVGTALMLGLVARARGAGGQKLLTSMLSSTAHALAEATTRWDGQPDPPYADAGAHGFHALYRLYPAREGWVFLAAPSEREWRRLAAALPDGAPLAADPRFASLEARQDHDQALAAELGRRFVTKPAAEWEQALRASDVACVEAAPGPVEAQYMDEGSPGQMSGYVVQAHHPILEDVPRLAPLWMFSRSATCAGDAGLVGQHTRQVLNDFGFGEDEVDELLREGVILAQ